MTVSHCGIIIALTLRTNHQIEQETKLVSICTLWPVKQLSAAKTLIFMEWIVSTLPKIKTLSDIDYSGSTVMSLK